MTGVADGIRLEGPAAMSAARLVARAAEDFQAELARGLARVETLRAQLAASSGNGDPSAAVLATSDRASSALRVAGEIGISGLRVGEELQLAVERQLVNDEQGARQAARLGERA